MSFEMLKIAHDEEIQFEYWGFLGDKGTVRDH